jgi:para-aminobenzoate synthetase component 1
MLHVRAIPPFDPARAARGLAALGARDTALFESSLPGGERGRWSLIAFDAMRRWTWFENTGWTITGATPSPLLAAMEVQLKRKAQRPWEGLAAAEAKLTAAGAADQGSDSLPPFRGGFAVSIAYDAARRLDGFEPWRAKAKDDVRWPWFDLRLYGAVAALDHSTGRAWIVAADHELFATSPQARSDAAAARLTRANSAGRTSDEEVADRAAEEAEEAALATATAAESGAEIAAAVGSTTPLAANMTDAQYAAAFAKLHKYLRAGDLYQANLTRRFEAPCTLEAPALYARLRRTAPAPYAVLLDDPERAIVSASPELFLARHGARLVTRPIKGTRPRDPDPERDAALAEELLASEKDRAEHVMIVDVHRNDLGRVCEFGTVVVEAMAAHEVFPTVHHLTSTIAGTLRPDAGSWEAIAASFPAGSITGAPKRRACEVLEELEPTRRAAYCGALGWWDLTGDFAFNVAIRTILLADGRATFQAGGGIVIDSQVDLEAAETWNKARALHAAIVGEERP